MLSAVEVARLLEGVAAALRTHVEPHVEDRFARMQLRAIDELLRNLADRVEWSLAELQAELEGMEELLARLRDAGWPGDGAAAETPAATTEEALARRLVLLGRLSEATRWAQQEGSQELRALVSSYLRETNDRERRRLQSGMYR
jgi:hypothetical protein